MKLPWLVAGTGLSAAISFSSGGIEADDVTSASPKNVHVIADPEPVRRRTRCRHDYYETRAGAKVFAAGAFMIAGSVWQGHVDQLMAILWNRLSKNDRRITLVTTTSLWLKEIRDDLPRARFGGRAEVVVIGGGVTGCSCALTLAERGVRVRLYEQREIAGGASGRNGGFALRGAAAPYDEARRELGDVHARAVMELTERALDRMEHLGGDAFRRVGSLRLAFDDDELAALRREHDALREDGFAVEWIDDLDPPLDRLYRGAILHPRDGALQPARWVRRLAGQAAAAGADLREGEQMTVEDADADAVVVAGDGYIRALLPELPVQPVRGQVLATEPLRELLYDRPHYARRGYDYWQQLPDGRLVIGGNRDASLATEETDVEETTELIQGRLEVLVESLVGYRPRVTDRWAGIWGATPDSVPVVGEARDGVWVAGGYSGHGNALGLACGELVARALLGDRPRELQIFAPARLIAA